MHCISIHTLYSVLSTFTVFWGMIRQALHIIIWQLSAILLLTSSPLKLCQVGWGQMHIFRFLQKYLIGFNLRLWLGHSRTFTELCISHSCCVFRVIVLLEGKPSAQSEVVNALDWVFINAISIFWCIELFFYSDESLGPCCWRTAPQHELLPAHFTAGMVLCMWWVVPGFLQTWCLEVHQTRESCSLTVWGSFRCFLANSKCVFMCLHWGEDWVWPHRHKAQIGGVLQWCLTFCRFLPSAYMITELN